MPGIRRALGVARALLVLAPSMPACATSSPPTASPDSAPARAAMHAEATTEGPAPAVSATPAPRAAGPVGAAAAAPQGAREELRWLEALRPDVLERIAKGTRPDASGAVGHNQPTWLGAQYQRGAGLLFLYALARSDRTAADDAWRAFDLAFSHQQPSGGFGYTNRSGTPGALKDDYSDTAFFLAQFCQAALVARASPFGEGYGARFDALVPKVRAAARFLREGKEVLASRDEPATNRYFIDALAYALAGRLAGDDGLVAVGASFVDRGLRKQDARGYFDEAGGSDTSYNNVSVLMLEVYDLYVPTPAIDGAVGRAVSWELPHVLPTGEIDVASNSRTGLGQETYFGKPKEVNYGEAVLALAFRGAARSDRALSETAERVFAFHFTSKAGPGGR